MHIQRFSAATHAEAYRQVLQILGPDAVVLLRSEGDSGVEWTVALDGEFGATRVKPRRDWRQSCQRKLPAVVPSRQTDNWCADLLEFAP